MSDKVHAFVMAKGTMIFTKAKEKSGTAWSLEEFMALHGNFSVLYEASTGLWYGRFNDKGQWIHVHIEKKIRRIPIMKFLEHPEDFEVRVTVETYCLYRKGDIIDYSTIWEELHPYETF